MWTPGVVDDIDYEEDGDYESQDDIDDKYVDEIEQEEIDELSSCYPNICTL